MAADEELLHLVRDVDDNILSEILTGHDRRHAQHHDVSTCVHMIKDGIVALHLPQADVPLEGIESDSQSREYATPAHRALCFAHDKLHAGHWKDVHDVWRDLYGCAAIVVSACRRCPFVTPPVIKIEESHQGQSTDKDKMTLAMLDVAVMMCRNSPPQSSADCQYKEMAGIKLSSVKSYVLCAINIIHGHHQRKRKLENKPVASRERSFAKCPRTLPTGDRSQCDQTFAPDTLYHAWKKGIERPSIHELSMKLPQGSLPSLLHRNHQGLPHTKVPLCHVYDSLDMETFYVNYLSKGYVKIIHNLLQALESWFVQSSVLCACNVSYTFQWLR